MNRNSRQKTAIIRILKETRCHPDAGWVYEQVKKEIPHISLGTVYRTLKILKESGEIREICGPGDTSHFDGSVNPHYHFRCDICGLILDIDEEVDMRLEERVARRTGYRITGHNLEFSGVCMGCQSGEPAAL